MKVFLCDHCRLLVFFESITCVRCGKRLAFLPELGVVGSLDPLGNGTYRSPLPRARDRTYRLCVNYFRENVCNWAVSTEDSNPLCRSCRLTRMIPNLGVPGNREAWGKLEAAKRRLLYTLVHLGLQVREANGAGLTFEFLADTGPGSPPVLTGHANGLITVNIAEADDAERERRRTELGEPYRTLLGHLRHESGHYYFDRLVATDQARLQRFRSLFGDERVDYAVALRRHYERGPVADWSDRFVSAYAGAHPWEDWAETWAHYLHMTDTLETGATCGLGMLPSRPEEPSIWRLPDPLGEEHVGFDAMLTGWHALTYLMNNLNRGLGLPDGYPFVLSAPAVAKLKFVHEMVRGT